ncbi:MAG: translation initiation factor IF-2 [Candidatus Paraimprobicoccus trichonymphae]|uniref:Translation initiation factor IF-2 n=1 Tax=Candidatus Paraimprobicoccus trichonymphae TaxID=3033793 RepID=A0AA48KWG7_9FIRM|nr:MAG: translation initiation factor IF-2 [Candidatus Paraimprobicoccus trichonymphae]
MMRKYRVHELAKDLKVANKEILNILKEYLNVEKKHMTALTEEELSVVFEYFTQKNQVESFDEYFKKKNDEEIEKIENIQIKDLNIKKPENVVVDIKSVSLNIDKYNEKYDKIALGEVPKNNIVASRYNKLNNTKFNYRDRFRFSKKRETEAERILRVTRERKNRKTVILLPDEITVKELSQRLKVTSTEVIKKLISMGNMSSINDFIDFDTASLISMEFFAKAEKENKINIEEKIINNRKDEEKDLVSRAPVVVIMGHVDHGKTSLLDCIRNSNVTSGEAGGITQHIGAYRVNLNDKEITFLDTPGHEAFTTMRARGAQVTDIAILVIAADDGVMSQTIEAINHARVAGVSIIVAINKIDKENANVEKVKQQLTEYNIVPEEWGGDVPCVPISTKNKIGIDSLLEIVLLVSDLKELKANPNRSARGTVIEAKLDKGRGPVATVLIQNGTLKIGDIVIVGFSLGRIRNMIDDKGKRVDQAGPSTPVEITGLDNVPNGGDILYVVFDEKLARELIDQRKNSKKEKMFSTKSKISLDNLFEQMSKADLKELKIIVKADVQGSVEAVKQSLEKLSDSEVKINIIHGAVGSITDSDVMLANASNAIIVGFNVRPEPDASKNAEKNNVDLRFYRIIYDCIEEISAAMKGLLAPKFREVQIGRAECRLVYKISSVGTIAGSYVLMGKVTKNSNIRVVRDGVVIFEDKVLSLKRFKDDVKEVTQGYECGIGLEKFNDIKEKDILESFVIEEYRDN